MSILKLRKVAELRKDLQNKLFVSGKRQASSYALCLQMLNSVNDNATFEVRGVNGGDIAESIVKHHLYGALSLTYARAGLKDLEGRLSEVKYFGATNNTPNGTLTPKAFIGITPYGAYHFTYAIVKKYFKDFKLDTRTNTRAMTYALMKRLVLSGEVNKLDELSKALGL